MSKTISVFGSSQPQEGNNEEYHIAYELGRELAVAGFTVCNGGYGGVMEASARGAREAGGKVIGITVETFTREANPWISKEIRAASLTERLTRLVNDADGYVILRGGTGTLLELAYAWELINKKMIPEKPVIILGDFWRGVVDTLKEKLLEEGLGDCTRFISIASSPSECVQILSERLG